MASTIGRRERERRAPTESGVVVYWLLLESAVAHFEVTRRQLVGAVRKGLLTSRRIFCGDDMAVALSSTELVERYERRDVPLTTATEPSSVSRRELARVKAHLDAAERVERSLQRYADRLEAELAKARHETLAMARALGRAEQLAASSAALPKRILNVS